MRTEQGLYKQTENLGDAFRKDDADFMVHFTEWKQSQRFTKQTFKLYTNKIIEPAF